MLGFNLGSYYACKVLWKACVECHTFFRLLAPKYSEQPSLGALPRQRTLSSRVAPFLRSLRLGSRFQFIGRTEFQAMAANKQRIRTEKHFVRTSSKRLF